MKPRLPYPVTVSLWIPGRPQQVDRGRAAVSTKGKPFIFSGKENKNRVQYVREQFEETIPPEHPLRPYLPVDNVYITYTAYCLYEPPKSYYSGQRRTQAPDWDNLGKLIPDALMGQGGRPNLLFRDDALIDTATVYKRYWDPTNKAPGYPQEPGTLAVFELHPLPRDPALLPEGECVCPTCGKDEFKSEGGYKIHVRRCKR